MSDRTGTCRHAGYRGLFQHEAEIQGCPLKSFPLSSWLCAVRAQRIAGCTWQKGKREEIVGAVFVAVNCQCGKKDQLDS